MDLKKDIHLSLDNYNWLSSLFYFGYLGWEYPTSVSPSMPSKAR